MAFLFDWLVEKCRRPQNEDDDIEDAIAASIEFALQDSTDLFAFEEQVKEIINFQLQDARENVAFEEASTVIAQRHTEIEEDTETIQEMDYNSIQRQSFKHTGAYDMPHI